MVFIGEAFQVENRVAGERFQVAENYIHPCFLDEKMKKDIITFTNEQGRLKKGDNWSPMDGHA